MEHFPHISANSQTFVLTGGGISKESGLEIRLETTKDYGIITVLRMSPHLKHLLEILP